MNGGCLFFFCLFLFFGFVFVVVFLALFQCAQKAFDTVVKRLTKIIRDGQIKKEVRPDIVPGELALFIYSSLEGGIFASRLQGSRQRLKIVARFLRDYLETEVRCR